MSLLQKNGLILFLFIAVVHFFYYPTWQSGFVTDFTGLAERIESRQFWDFLSSFDFPALQPVLNFFLFLFYKGFGTAGLPWYLVYTSLHILNAFLLHRLILQLSAHYGMNHAAFPAFAAASLFLLSPYATEVVVWKVSFSFLMVSALILFILINVLNWLKTRQSKYSNRVLILFIIALFTFELPLTVPFFVTVMLFFQYFHSGERQVLRTGFFKFLLPQLSIIGFYFILNKIVLGTWIGHYGAAVHLRFDLLEILSNYAKYSIKFLLFARYWEHSDKAWLFEQPSLLVIISLIVMIGLLSWFLFFKKIAVRFRLAGLFLLFFVIALLPVINLYFNYLLLVENDRHGYFAALFFWAFFATGLSFLPGSIQRLLFAGWLIPSLFLLFFTNDNWAKATHLYRNLLSDFRWDGKKELYILNVPDNYNGILMLRDYSGEDQSVADALKHVQKKPFEGKIYEVIHYNMVTPGDGVSAQVDSTGNIIVTFNQWGNWWWRRGIGASDYETEQYRWANKGHFYVLQFKRKPEEALFIYQQGGSWKELVFE